MIAEIVNLYSIHAGLVCIAQHSKKYYRAVITGKSKELTPVDPIKVCVSVVPLLVVLQNTQSVMMMCGCAFVVVRYCLAKEHLLTRDYIMCVSVLPVVRYRCPASKQSTC